MRLFAKIILGIVGLAMLGLAIFLVPPHLQTQGIEPDIPNKQALRSLMTAEEGPIAVHYVLTASQEVRGRDLGHTSFVIEWANGNLFLIDAGMDETGAAEFADLMAGISGGGEAKFFGTLGAQLGSDLERVKGIGFTHLHIDHSQGVTAFCETRGAGTDLLQTNDQRDEHNFNTVEGAGIVSNSCLSRGALDGREILVNDAFPGLGLIALGGHTPGSTLFAVGLKDHLWLFSGDTTNTKTDLVNNRGKGFVYSGLFVPENTGRTEDLRLWLTGLDTNDDIDVVVSHDLAALLESGLPEFNQ
ncbi:MBL fold metallo-hydrolase [Parvibaculaceae bacterium PLY_AMNH_Bact1]|nr:MBL fold metallo-hydrolase [Parvibaculaceae bacterium PLY_AMNH_Bact1]